MPFAATSGGTTISIMRKNGSANQRHDRHLRLQRHPGGAGLEFLELEAAADRRLGIDPDHLALA
ncbi:hypothetical protein MFM001_05670 [Mycobacterium sp. MFM001]|nr:hypothetical protein MFM001_05670 [Mycobacterium sp. MFM001]